MLTGSYTAWSVAVCLFICAMRARLCRRGAWLKVLKGECDTCRKLSLAELDLLPADARAVCGGTALPFPQRTGGLPTLKSGSTCPQVGRYLPALGSTRV